MFDFSAIGLNNGWAMAGVGAIIVFSGLVVLSFAISLLHKLLELWDKRSQFKSIFNITDSNTRESDKAEKAAVLSYLNINEAAQNYRALTSLIEEPFLLTDLYSLTKHRILFTPLPRFQVVLRDFSMVLDKQVTFESLRSLAFKTERKLLKNVTLFDVYDGEKIEKGKKSYALSFTLLDENKTLTDKQIDKVMLNLARAFERDFGAKIRGMS